MKSTTSRSNPWFYVAIAFFCVATLVIPDKWIWKVILTGLLGFVAVVQFAIDTAVEYPDEYDL
jgi:hypothetical protein